MNREEIFKVLNKNKDFLCGLSLGISISICVYYFLIKDHANTVLSLILLCLMVLIFLISREEIEREERVKKRGEKSRNIF